MTKSRAIVIVLTTLAVAAIAVLIKWPDPLKNALGDEVYKLFLQFSLLTVVVGLVSAVFSELKRESESREAQRQWLRSFHTRAWTAYNQAKKLRRLMTILPLYDRNETTYLRKKDYWDLMIELEGVQLEFDSLMRQVKVYSVSFEASPQIENSFYEMEDYLRGVLKEFEAARFPDAETDCELSTFPKLQAFLDDKSRPNSTTISLGLSM